MLKQTRILVSNLKFKIETNNLNFKTPSQMSEPEFRTLTKNE